jgi:hypothetical protein
MRSRTLASAIALGCATWAPSLAMFVPGAVAAQVTSDTPSSNPSALAPTPTRRLTLTEALSLAETANPALRTVGAARRGARCAHGSQRAALQQP